MIRLFSLIGAVCVLIFATQIYVCAVDSTLDTSEVRQQLGLYGFFNFGVIPTDPAQWDDKTRKEFFGNLPPELHQRYIETFTKLHKANAEYWKTRAELFKVIHPLFERDELETALKQKNEILARDKREYDSAVKIDRPSVWALKQYEKTIEEYKALEAMLEGNYSLYAAQQAHKNVIHYLWNNHHDFDHYPDVLDPNKEAEFWNALAEETQYLYDLMIESCRQRTEAHKNQIVDFKNRLDEMTIKDLPNDMKGMLYLHTGGYGTIAPPTDEQKSRLLNDEPLFVGTKRFFHDYLRLDEYNILKAARDAEREAWKIETTPELSKLGIDQEEVARWDGSLSLHPFIRAIAERCKGIDLTLLQTTIDHSVMMQLHVAVFPTDKTTLSNTHPALMALIQGKKDAVFSTRRLSKMEIAEAKNRGVELVQVPFVKDAFVFLQNRHNPVRNLSLEQYQDVFSGKYNSWKEVGGFGGDIKPLVRNENSGSEELMQTLVMRNIPVHENFKPKKLDSMSVVFEVLENFPGGIAYSIYHYDRYMVFNVYTRVMGVNGVFPNAETIASEEYPLVYECVLVHRKNPGKKVERLVRWLLSDEGQKLVRYVGYVPVRE